LKDYLGGWYKKSEAEKYTKFGHSIRHVEWLEDKQKFRVNLYDLGTEKNYVVEHDYIICASGHFSTPNMVTFPGFETFPGKIIHARDFREGADYEGQRVLIIGSSFSGEEVGAQALKYGAKSIVLTYRTNETGHGIFPEGDNRWKEQPLLTKVEGKTVHFKNGETAIVDSIIVCTGYIHSFPFMADDLTLKTENLLWVDNLWKGIVWVENPKLFYLSMQNQNYTFPYFSAQGWLARDIIMGKVRVPSREEMQKDNEKWKKHFDNIKTAYDTVSYQGDHVDHIAKMTDHPDIKVDEVNHLLFDCIDNKNKPRGIIEYRNVSHKSPYTGIVSPLPKKDWWENFDDDLETYLKDYKK